MTETMTRSNDLLTAARAEALFTSHLSAGSSPSLPAVHAAIKHAVRTFGGTRGCAGEVAAAYGDYPDTAAPRMRWAQRVVTSVYRQQAP
jgi:hypothetical protein